VAGKREHQLRLAAIFVVVMKLQTVGRYPLALFANKFPSLTPPARVEAFRANHRHH
jgi:hypothetical protein